MRSPANSLRADLRKSAKEAKDAKAAELFGLEQVRQAMTGRAGKGFDFVVIEAPDGLDLRATPAAVAAVEWLASMKLPAEWEARKGGTGEDGASSYSLRISWAVSSADA